MNTLRRSRYVALLVVLLFAGATCGIREDELLCEEAISRIAGCCPTFPAHQFNCTYSNFSCGGQPSENFPDLRITTSRCILDLSCETIRARGLCEAPLGPTQCTP